MEKKECSKCGVAKPLDQFSFRTDNGAYRGQCKKCRNAYFKKYNDTNPKRVEYRTKNREKIRQDNKRYRSKNKDRESQRHKEYRAKNKDSLAEKDAKWYRENKERKRESRRRWSENNRDRVRKKKLEWRQNNLDRHREYSSRRRAATKELESEKVDYELIRERDDFCYLCGEEFTYEEKWDSSLTHVDHIIPLSRSELSPTHSYDNCALTHAKCNLRKSSKTPEEYFDS